LPSANEIAESRKNPAWHASLEELEQAMNLLGERWSVLVLASLINEPSRFTHLRQSLPGISGTVLAARLRQLEERSLVERVLLPPPASVSIYRATAKAAELRPVLKLLAKWGAAGISSSRTREGAPGSQSRKLANE